MGSICFPLIVPPPVEAFQCSPTSRVGVNVNCKGVKTVSKPVSVLSDEPCWGQSSLPCKRLSFQNQFQCSPTSRVGVNWVVGQVAAGGIEFQCSPTSRVGVNRIDCSLSKLLPVSVLSDEPCWGQSGATAWFWWWRHGVSVLSDEPCWGQFCSASVEMVGM